MLNSLSNVCGLSVKLLSEESSKSSAEESRPKFPLQSNLPGASGMGAFVGPREQEPFAHNGG